MGPITLFDKSFLQQLNIDEAVWFDNFFYPVIAPLFFIETLADLEKTPREGKTAEQEMGIIASKTPQMSGGPCHFHRELCIQDLLGNHVPLTGQIPMAGMRRVVRDGKESGVLEVSPERKAFDRWQDGQFYNLERNHARQWRAHLARIDLGAIEQAMKQSGIDSKSCKSLEAALKIADEVVLGLSKSHGRFDSMLEVIDIPLSVRPHVKHRWKMMKRPPLRTFAPYAAHVLRVEIFFRAALGANLIASTRPSHRVDMSYLFYLPFCTIFTSTDKLHRQCAPLFMRGNQEFVWGQDLKADLRALNEHFSSLPPETRAQGIYKFADRLPDESQGLIRALFQRHTPSLLRPKVTVDVSKISAEANAKLVKTIKDLESSEGDDTPFAADKELDSLILKRTVLRQRGNWMQIGPEVSDQGR